MVGMQYFIRAKVKAYLIPLGTSNVAVPAYRELGPYDNEHTMMKDLVDLLEENGGNGTAVEVVQRDSRLGNE